MTLSYCFVLVVVVCYDSVCLCAKRLLAINKILFNEKKKKKVRICTDTVQVFLFIIEFVTEFVQGFFLFFYNRICIDTKFEIQECLKYKSTVKCKGI